MFMCTIHQKQNILSKIKAPTLCKTYNYGLQVMLLVAFFVVYLSLTIAYTSFKT